MATKNYADAMLDVLETFMEEDPLFAVMGNEVLGHRPRGRAVRALPEEVRRPHLLPALLGGRLRGARGGRGDVRAADLRPPGARALHLSGVLVDRLRDRARAAVLGRQGGRAGHDPHEPRAAPRRRRAAQREPARHVLEPARDRDHHALDPGGPEGPPAHGDQERQPHDRGHARVRLRRRGRGARRRLRDPVRPGRRQARGHRRDARELLDDGRRRAGGGRDAGGRGHRGRGGGPAHPRRRSTSGPSWTRWPRPAAW